MVHYFAVLIPDTRPKKRGYSVVFPDLMGCASQGDSVAEAMAMAAEALAGHVAAMQAHGEAVPPASSVEAIRADKVFAKDFEIDWRTSIVIPVGLRAAVGRPERVNVSLDSNVLRDLDLYAEGRGLTRSGAIEAGVQMLMESDPLPARNAKPRKAGKAA